MEEKVKEVAETKEKLNEFLKERTMFYVDSAGNIIYPEYRYKDITHRQWLTAIKKNVSDTICGFILNNQIRIYNGNDYSVPNINIKTIFQLRTFDRYAEIQLGCYRGEPGELWKGMLEIGFYELKNPNEKED